MSSSSQAIEKGIETFQDFFSELTEERVNEKVSQVYAPKAYLNDTLKEVRGVDAIRDYFIENARAVESCRVEVNDVAVSGESRYLRWTMEIEFKKLKKGQLTRSEGVSHLKFDENGLVTYHQDYWDSASAFFEHLPLLGGLIRLVRNRI